ncbi:MAG TPA: DUF262 domain-containing protein [Dehalococcoidia bacterium]|nr:DUF262 domain-containing protein [Dehalococcoidia bacterium]
MPDTTIKSLITPHDQTLRTVFNTQRSYFIDIYQREYKWDSTQVRTLLDDIDVQFSQHDRRKTQPREIQEDVLDRFQPYFLNTYLTHTTAANTSIVDGQQRLTTLLLILIRLYHMVKAVEQEAPGKTFSSRTIQQLIFETNDFGEAERFKIYNENREEAFQSLIEGREVDARDETRRRIKENSKWISDYFNSFLRDGNGNVDTVKMTYYLSYLLDRISIVEIRIERQENVAMIFEVVNDRGLGLKPYEILKGKLIGNLTGQQKERANDVWSELQEKYFAAVLKNTTEKSIDLDTFFRTFFRAKFADSENDYEKFEGDYKYEMYRNAKIRQFFGDFNDRDSVYRRLTEDIRYFAELYLRMRTSYEWDDVIFNKLLDQNQQYLLILSNIMQKDPNETDKIRGIAKKFDQIHVILRLLGAYDSNDFQRLIYPLNVAVRNKSLDDAVPEFDKMLSTALADAGLIAAESQYQAVDLFEYERFKWTSNKWLNFSKYVLMRIDRYLSELMDNKPSYASADLETLENRFNRNNLKQHGMHLEHMYTQHPKNKALFTTNGILDETSFQQTRNRLGMVLLLKDKLNLSSNDEIYVDKLTTYSGSNLIWNELLSGSVPEVYMRGLPADLVLKRIEPTPDGVFPIDKVEERQKAVFAAIKAIWGSF